MPAYIGGAMVVGGLLQGQSAQKCGSGNLPPRN
jgi:hypothetical protein